MRHIFKKYILILLVLSMVVSSFATTASAFSFTGGSITMTNLHPNATVKYEHIIRPNTSRETGWEFFPGLDSGYDCWYSILHAFAEAYGFGSLDNKFDGKLSTSWATATEEYIAFEQEVLKAVIADYDKSYGNGDPNTAAISGTVNASKNFREALRLSNEYYIIKKGKGGTKTANGNGEVTVVNTTSNNDKEIILTQTGLYLIVPQGNSEYSYNPTAAYLGFQYSSNIPNAHQSVTVKAKRISNIAHKTGDQTTASIGDTVNYTVTSTYPYIPEDYWDTALYKIIDWSYQLGTYQNIKVSIEGVGEIKDYAQGAWVDASGFIITLVDGTSRPYKPEYAGKKVTITYYAKIASLNDNGKVENQANVYIKSEGDELVTASRWIIDTYEYKLVKTNDYSNDKRDIERETLTGAEFKVKVGNQYVVFDVVQGEGDNADKYIAKGLNSTGTTVTVRTRAGVIFAGLDADNVYVISETKAPDGYSKSSQTVELSKKALGFDVVQVTKQENNTTTITNTIKFNAGAKEEVTSGNLYADFKNTKLYDLPETGSIGTYVFTLVGVSVMASALLVFVSQRRRETEV